MTVSATTLRQNVYKLLDRIDLTGEPIEVSRKNKWYKVVPIKGPKKNTKKKKGSILNTLIKREGFLVEDQEYYVHIDWSKEWKPYL
jgi:antitoxin (DNA-binding transcriptional repressor) of toxin-antitoxin stability system